MNPFRRRRRTRRDMIVLGGWLFADLLLGLAMIFLVANTVGAPPPEPTPTATPDELATAEASFAAVQAADRATEQALQRDVAMLEQTAVAQQNLDASRRIAATQTAEAQATEAALSDSDLATRDAQATEEAVIAQATISAFSTEVAASDADDAALLSDLATISAQATTVSAQIDAQATEQAEVSAIATENASSGASTQATVEALEASNAENASALATSRAQNVDIQARQDELEATATAFAAVADTGTIDPNSVEEIIQVDLTGLLSEDEAAIQEAQEEISDVFGPYAESGDCRAAFVLTSSRAAELGNGVELSREVNRLLVETVPDVFEETAFESIALPGTQPEGEVILQVFLFSGCSVTEGE